MLVAIHVLLLLCLSFKICKSKMPDLNAAEELLKSHMLPTCEACRVLVNSFKKGMKKTARSSFEGGDTAWEEEKLLIYATSEVRLTEIQEKLCSDVEKAQGQCHTLSNDYEHLLEEWWFNHQKNKPNLMEWLCQDTLKHCCPENTFGLNCDPCPGYPDNVCAGNGMCKGAGTRKGSGECSCQTGYDGPLCNNCAPMFYEAYRDNSKLLCSECHASCQDVCAQSGPKGCAACKTGWIMDLERGCIDVNECVSNAQPCSLNEFCVNNEGSYTCLACDRACEGCHGDGPDMCENCAEGFNLINGLCVAVNVPVKETVQFHLDL